MPELPEVETVARQLRKHIIGRQMVSVDASPVNIFQNIPASEFARLLEGKTVDGIFRHGKFLCWETGGLYPVFHLGMSGIFIRDAGLSNYPQHIHVKFGFEDGTKLFFQDVRKFGKIYLYREKPGFQDLGPDPLTENFTLKKLSELLSLKSVNIKTLLMDQHTIAGIGNIYANEILFDAGISPFRPARNISSEEGKKLYGSIRKILVEAIERFGTTYTAYRTVDGNSGENQNFLRVYQRAGEPCVRCGQKLQKQVLNSRSTFYCKNCQE